MLWERFKMATMAAIFDMDLVATKPVFGISDKTRLKPVSQATETR